MRSMLPSMAGGRRLRPRGASRRSITIVSAEPGDTPRPLAWIIHPMSYCAARLHAISGRPRSSLGDTIPSCPQ
ncbi:MAG: hypothetical protein V3R89_05210, partial [Thermoanaerobaculia bacterium]